MSKVDGNMNRSFDLSKLTPEEKKKLDDFMEELFFMAINARSKE